MSIANFWSRFGEEIVYGGSIGRNWVYTFGRRMAKKEIPDPMYPILLLQCKITVCLIRREVTKGGNDAEPCKGPAQF